MKVMTICCAFSLLIASPLSTFESDENTLLNGNLTGSVKFATDYVFRGESGEGAEGWTHWNLGISKTLWGLIFDLRYHDTDVDSSH